ncbi:hypothetical protein HHI36_006992, partial [Cryptolaemus montrouzieri]
TSYTEQKDKKSLQSDLLDSSSDDNQLTAANNNGCSDDNQLLATGTNRCSDFLMDGAEKEGTIFQNQCIQITNEVRVDTFNDYYGFGDLTRKREYSVRHIKSEDTKKTITGKKGSHRKQSLKYNPSAAICTSNFHSFRY